MSDIEEHFSKLKKRESEINFQIENYNRTISTYKNIAWWLVVAGLVIIGLSLYDFLKNNTEPGFGLNLYGDFLSGSVGSIWALSGILFIYIAFLGQRQQLLYQKIDLLYNHFEMIQTRNEMKKQNKTFAMQRFENTFFQMLDLFNSVIESTELNVSTPVQKSRKAFIFIAKELEDEVSLYSRNPSIIAVVLQSKEKSTRINTLDYLTVNDLNIIYDRIYQRYQDVLGHYFRTYYHIIKLVDKTNGIDKAHYISIARAQLSNSEQLLLFYNCLHKNGTEKFKPLVEEYALLHNMNIDELPSLYYKEFYKKSAYGI